MGPSGDPGVGKKVGTETEVFSLVRNLNVLLQRLNLGSVRLIHKLADKPAGAVLL